MSRARILSLSALALLVISGASCARGGGGGGGGGGDGVGGGGSCITPSHLQGEWRFQYDELDMSLAIDEDGASEFTMAGEPDFLGSTSEPIGDDICDMFFDWGEGDPEDVRFGLRKTNGSGLTIAIPANFDVCDAPPSALDGRWEFEMDYLGDGEDNLTMVLDIDDDSAALTYTEDGEVEEWADCVVSGSMCDLTIACDDTVAMRLERL